MANKEILNSILTGSVIGETAGKILTGVVILAVLLIIFYIFIKIKNKKTTTKSETSSREENPITGGHTNPIFGKKSSNPILNKLSGKIVDETKS